MIYSIIAFLIAVVLWVLFSYLATVYEVLIGTVSVFMWITVAVAAVFIVLEIIIRIKNSMYRGGK